MNALANVLSPRYISPTGTDINNNCINLNIPCATWQHTLDSAQPGDTILAATGIYTDIIVSSNITQVAIISHPVTIQGGYTLTFTEPPDPAANPTILDAQGQGRVLSILDAGQVTLNGLHLTGGTTSGQADRGGGLYAINTDINLVDNVIIQNQAGYGGGVYLQHSHIQVQGNYISENRAQLSGGGIRCYDCTGNIEHNQILSNTAVLHGGGLQITNSPFRLSHNQIYNNQVSTNINGWGGGIHLHNSDAMLIGNRIDNNIAYRGGGLRLINSAASLQGNVIQDNEATVGGGLTIETGSDAILENNAFVNNVSPASDASIYILDANPTLDHTTFNGNGETAVLVEGSSNVSLHNSVIANQALGVVNYGDAVTLTTTLLDNVMTYTQGFVQATDTITGAAGFATDGYHLTGASDALNNASPSEITIDIDNQSRPHLGSADIGADEWWSLDARKFVSHPSAQPGFTITYTIHLTNTVVSPTNIILTDTLPAQVDYLGPISATSGTASFSNGAVRWQGNLNEQEAVLISWPVQLHSNLQPGTIITNSAIIQDEQGIYNTTTAVTIIPSEIYLPLITK